MKNFLLITLILLSSVSNSRLRADEPAETKNSENRLFDAYVQYMDAKDWEMAEVIALGAKAKFGEQHTVVQRMLSEVEKGIASEVLAVGRIDFFPLTISTRPQPKRPVVTNANYSLEEQLTDKGELGRSQILAICDQLRTEIDKQDWPQGEIELFPFVTNRSLIVVATAERHQFVQDYLAKLPREKQIQASETKE